MNANFLMEKVKDVAKVEQLSANSYRIVMKSGDGEELSAICSFKTAGQNASKIAEFDGDEFNKQIMQGYIEVKKVMAAIHKIQP